MSKDKITDTASIKKILDTLEKTEHENIYRILATASVYFGVSEDVIMTLKNN